jgi:hypothetical protein
VQTEGRQAVLRTIPLNAIYKCTYWCISDLGCGLWRFECDEASSLEATGVGVLEPLEVGDLPAVLHRILQKGGNGGGTREEQINEKTE